MFLLEHSSIYNYGGMVVQWLGPEFDSTVQPCCVLFVWFSPSTPRTSQLVRLTGDCEWPTGLNGRSPCDRPVRGVPRLSPCGSWDTLQHPCSPDKRKRILPRVTVSLRENGNKPTDLVVLSRSQS